MTLKMLQSLKKTEIILVVEELMGHADTSKNKGFCIGRKSRKLPLEG